MAATLLHNQNSGTKDVVKCNVGFTGSPQSITGFQAPSNGTRLLIVHIDAETSFIDDSPDSSVGNRIKLLGNNGGPFQPESVLLFSYSSPYWYLISVQSA